MNGMINNLQPNIQDVQQVDTSSVVSTNDRIRNNKSQSQLRAPGLESLESSKVDDDGMDSMNDEVRKMKEYYDKMDPIQRKQIEEMTSQLLGDIPFDAMFSEFGQSTNSRSAHGTKKQQQKKYK